MASVFPLKDLFIIGSVKKQSGLEKFLIFIFLFKMYLSKYLNL